MISKKLLSEILGKNINSVNMGVPKEFKEDNMLYYTVDMDYGVHHYINIYELMAKAKEWAYENFIQITSTRLPSGYWNIHYNDGSFKDFSASTEHEAVFKACEFILKALNEN